MKLYTEMCENSLLNTYVGAGLGGISGFLNWRVAAAALRVNSTAVLRFTPDGETVTWASLPGDCVDGEAGGGLEADSDK